MRSYHLFDFDRFRLGTYTDLVEERRSYVSYNFYHFSFKRLVVCECAGRLLIQRMARNKADAHKHYFCSIHSVLRGIEHCSPNTSSAEPSGSSHNYLPATRNSLYYYCRYELMPTHYTCQIYENPARLYFRIKFDTQVFPLNLIRFSNSRRMLLQCRREIIKFSRVTFYNRNQSENDLNSMEC